MCGNGFLLLKQTCNCVTHDCMGEQQPKMRLHSNRHIIKLRMVCIFTLHFHTFHFRHATEYAEVLMVSKKVRVPHATRKLNSEKKRNATKYIKWKQALRWREMCTLSHQINIISVAISEWLNLTKKIDPMINCKHRLHLPIASCATLIISRIYTNVWIVYLASNMYERKR